VLKAPAATALAWAGNISPVHLAKN
jgi:hypothetical protein